MINDFNISFLVNLENDVSDSRELLSYAVIDRVKHTAVLVKFDETDVDAVKINVLIHNELFDVFHTQSDGNYAACSCDSEYESTDCISGTDHGDAQSLNKSPRQKRKRFKTKRATLAKPPAISTSNNVNKSTKESNIGGNLVENCDFKYNHTMVYMQLTCISYSINCISSHISWLDISSWNSS